ncbi:pseudouridine synthase, partial [Massilistercora timonensis]|uniref:pseudouridine synthase n=1 Tax=Massilistercora timonensis TaxID=2086584 RepID=UPI003AB18F35
MMRLDKYLAEMGEGTRQEVKAFIRKGRVMVGGVPVKKPEAKVEEGKDQVTLDGREIPYQKYLYYMLNKPAGVITATTDSRDRTVLDLLGEDRRKDLFPVGRLDKDTEGLLLITNDGPLAHRLLSPKKHVDKCYYAKVRGEVTGEDVEQFAQGLFLAGLGEEKEEKTMPARLEILKTVSTGGEEDPGFVSEILLTIQEGKFHQVKRMFQAVGKEVLYLKRLSMGSLKLDPELAPGQYRELTKEE